MKIVMFLLIKIIFLVNFCYADFDKELNQFYKDLNSESFTWSTLLFINTTAHHKLITDTLSKSRRESNYYLKESYFNDVKKLGEKFGYIKDLLMIYIDYITNKEKKIKFRNFITKKIRLVILENDLLFKLIKTSSVDPTNNKKDILILVNKCNKLLKNFYENNLKNK